MMRLGRLARCKRLRDGDVSLAAEATLFDRVELAAALALTPNATDIELILAAYRRWGADCPAHLNGDYRFIVEDASSGMVFAAVDHMATRPLFYAEVDGKPVFSSSVRALADHLGGHPVLNETVTANLLVDFMHWSHSETLCRDIHKVPPGHTIEWKDGQKTVRRYWFPERTEPLNLPSTKAYVERGRQVFAAAVADRCLSADLIGVHASGGLDSSAIAAICTRLRREAGLSDPHGFAWQQWDKRDSPTSEGGWIASLQSELGIPINGLEPTVEDAKRLFKLDLAADYNVGNLFNEDCIQRAAADQGIGLILSGFGGDELLTFNGKFMPSHHARRGDLRALTNLHRKGGLRGLAAGVVQAFREITTRPPTTANPQKLAKTFAHPDLLARVEIEPSWKPHARGPREHQLDRLGNGALNERIEVLAQSGERRGLQYSFPMLDRRVIEFALSVPVELFWRDGLRRWLFREMMKGVLPETVRMNQSKYEPVRVKGAMDAVIPALREIGKEIEQRDDFQRAGLIDLERLRAAIREPEQARGIAHLRLAVQLLDL